MLSEVRVSKTLGGKNTFGYRTKLTPRFDLPRRRRPDFVPNIGFRERGRFRIADVSKCLIASDAINDVLPKVREEVHNRIDEYARGAQLLLRDDGTGHVITDPREIVTTSICGIKFDYSAHDFFQVNHEVTEILVTEVLTRCDFEDVDYVADMYSGCGMFAVHIAATLVSVVVLWVLKYHLAQSSVLVIMQTERVSRMYLSSVASPNPYSKLSSRILALIPIEPVS